MAKNTSCGVQLRIRGKVQGVGFRPFVWQLAQQLNLHGDVCNDGDGVEVRLLEDPETFLVQLHQHCPPLARIDSVEREPFIWSQLPTEFTIRQSAGGAMNTQIVPDAATCPACLAEMNTPGERRYRYPFINCTHCGPRFTIIRAMPYDRPFTVMAEFPLCPACDKEYRDPLDRRFHAQPVACPECGPHLEWVSHGEHAEQEAALQAAIAQLKMGNILIAVDLSPESKVLVEKAVSMARPYNAKVSLIHVDVNYSDLYTGLIDVNLGDMQKRISEETHHALTELSTNAGYPITETLSGSGDLGQVLVDAIKKYDMDLVVCGHHQDFWSKLMSSARQLINTVHVDMLIVPLRDEEE